MGSINGSEDVRLDDIPSLAATLQERLKEAPQYSRRRCIFRVPNLLRQTNEQAYTPLLVSIGPLHHNDKRLRPMEAHKLKYLQSFLGERQANAAELLNSCLTIVKDNETKIRECYADPIYLSSDDFIQMVLIDSAFIIEFFRKMRIHQRENDYVHGMPFLFLTVRRDIRLEENQLPFFILDQLYGAAFQTNAQSSNSVPSFTEIACKGLGVKLDVNANVGETDYYHLLHLLAYHRQRAIRTVRDEVEGELIEKVLVPSATQLHEAGVKFQVIKDSSSLLDIEFDNVKGILKIPEIGVGGDTEYMHRNLIAFEQCHYYLDQTRYFTDYHLFLNLLIKTPQDVQLLAEVGIIHNFKGSPEKASDLINSLDTNAHPSPEGYYYKQISLQLQGHCKKRWNRYRATLMHTYFNHPWATLSVIYAIILLLLTVIQVVAGIMAIP